MKEICTIKSWWRIRPLMAISTTVTQGQVHFGGQFRLQYFSNVYVDCRGSRREYSRVAGRNIFFGDMNKLCEEGRLTEALQIMDLMVKQGTHFHINTYACLLKGCSRMKALPLGRQVHAYIIKAGFQSNIFLGNTLIDMYAKCGCVSDARQVFDRMPKHNVFSWSAIISAYAIQGRGKEAFSLFNQMQQVGVAPDKVIIIIILKVCAIQAALEWGKQVHSLIIKSGFESDVFVGSTLVHMYAKCGHIEDAHRVLNNMSKRNVVSWNAIIGGCAHNGHDKEAFTLFEQMQQEGVKPNHVTFINVIKVCANLADLERGKKVHSHVMKADFESLIYIGNALIDMYAKCGSIEDAHKVFNKMGKQDVVSWTAIIAGYSQQGFGEAALTLFEQMQREGVKPNNVTFVIIFKTCANLTALDQGKQLHSLSIEMGLNSDVFVASALVDMYAKCGRIEDARQVFNSMAERDAVSWTVMIAAYAQHGQGEEALTLVEQMQQEGMKPDKITFLSILKACIALESLEQGKKFHTHIIKCGFESDVYVRNTLMDLYAKCGDIKEACKLFNQMPERDVASWNVIIAGCAQHGLAKDALRLFEQMQMMGIKPNGITFISILKACVSLTSLEWGKRIHEDIINSGFESDIFVGSMLVDMYFKCGSRKDACHVFSKMPERNVVSWNAMITGCAQQGDAQDALTIFEQMQQESVKPDRITFITILKACASLAALEWGKLVHAHVIRSGFDSEVSVGNALIDMYAKCGNIQNACLVFNKMCERDLVSWNAMITGYAQQGHAKDALTVFDEMQHQGLKPNEVTFVSVLTVCRHAGLLDEGHRHFISMYQCHNIIPTLEHYTCMVDLFGRAGSLDEAEEVINKMQIQPDALIWMTLLASCRCHGNMKLGRHAFDIVLKLEPKWDGAYALLSNIYAATGSWEQVARIRKEMDGTFEGTWM